MKSLLQKSVYIYAKKIGEKHENEIITFIIKIILPKGFFLCQIVLNNYSAYETISI